MSTYAEMDRLRKLARPLYLELRALGIELRAEEDAQDPTGYALLVGGLRSLSPRRTRTVSGGALRRTRWDWCAWWGSVSGAGISEQFGERG